jgi:hypothetical protein
MRIMTSTRATVLLALLVTVLPLTAGASGPADPERVVDTAPGTCFVGDTIALDCVEAQSYASDANLAADAQTAQIEASGAVSTNGSCGYYLSSTVVSVYGPKKFKNAYNTELAAMGVTVVKNTTLPMPSGFNALDIVPVVSGSSTDAYNLVANLYAAHILGAADPLAIGRVAPIFVLGAAGIPRGVPGTQPTPDPVHTPFVQSLAPMHEVVVFDTSFDPADDKFDVSPADGWMDATAGHSTFIQDVAASVYQGSVVAVDVTDERGLFTEANVASVIDSYTFSVGDVASFSAGTYGCEVKDPTDPSNEIPIEPMLLGDMVTRLADSGVHLVAGAGNDATDRFFYPAAYGVEPVPVIDNSCTGGTWDRDKKLCYADYSDTVTSVGSVVSAPKTLVSVKVPSASQRSSFSNFGSWVEAWADGDGLVAAYPAGPYSYCISVGNGVCEAPAGTTSFDYDTPAANLGTTVLWSGTSFATPQVAAWIAAGNQAP